MVVLKGASLQAQDSPGGSGCGVKVLAQVQLLAVKVQWLHWGLALHPICCRWFRPNSWEPVHRNVF